VKENGTTSLACWSSAKTHQRMDGANTKILILKSTYEQWGQLKQLKNLCNDDAVAQYLLSCYVNLSAQRCQSTREESPEAPITQEEYTSSLP